MLSRSSHCHEEVHREGKSASLSTGKLGMETWSSPAVLSFQIQNCNAAPQGFPGTCQKCSSAV